MQLHKPTNRREKIAHEIFRVVSPLIHFEMDDPMLEGVSITTVKMTPDLGVARIYFSIPGAAEKAPVVKKALQKQAWLFRKRVAEEINLKWAPQFEFFYDESLELQDRIDSLFDEIGKNKTS